MDNLTPQLSVDQIKQNIDALKKQGKDSRSIQSYVDNYKRDEGGNFVLKSDTVQEQPNRDLLQKATDIATTIFPGKQVGESIGTLLGAGITGTKEALGIVPKGTLEQYDLSAPTPTQVLGDVAKGALTISGAKLPVAPSILGKVAQFSALGGVGGLAEGVASGDTKEQTIDKVKTGALVGGATGALFGVAEKGFKVIGNLLGKTGEKIQTSVIKPSQTDIKDGFSIDTIKKYNLGGSLKTTFAKTDEAIDTLTKELNSKLGSSGTKLDLNKVYENTVKKLAGNKLESFGANTQMTGAIEKLKSEIASIAQDGSVSIPEAQLVKRASGHFGAWSFGVPTPEATASQKVYNTFYNQLKTAIEDASPEGVKEINKEISKLIPVMNALIKRIPIAERNSALSLTDIISLTGASIDPKALSVSLLNLASKSGSVGSILSKAPQVAEKGINAIKSLEQVGQAVTAN